MKSLFNCKRFILSVLFLLLILLNHAEAQTYNILGKVVDQFSNPIPGVNIIVVNTNLGTASDQKGNYKISNLQAGKYNIEFSAIGFQKVTKRNVTITNKSITLNVVLVEKIIRTEDVVVTAGKYQQNKSDLPVSTEIIYGNSLVGRNFSNLEDAMRYVPGISMTEDQVSIRGSSGYSRGVGARALFTLDGIPFYTGDTGEIVWEMVPVTEIQRIEIIKGAASSLYGSSAIGGVISALTKDVSQKPQTIVNGFYGFYDKPYYDEWDWSGQLRPFNGLTISHSQKIINFNVNASFTRLEDQGYRRDDFFKKYIGFIKASYSFSPASSLTFLANTFNKRGGSFLYWKNSRNALITSDNVEVTRVNTNRYLFGLTYKNVLSDKAAINVKTSYYRNNFEDNGSPSNLSTSHLYRGEFQLNASLTNSIMLTTGIEILPAKVNSSLFGNPTSFGTGIYAVTDFSFSFPLIASLGFRYDYNKLDSLDASGAFSPKLGLNYKPLNNLILRSSLGTGFRAPSLAEAFTSTSTSGITVKPNPEIKPESNVTFEFGLNYQPISSINLDLAVFHNEYYDMIEAGIDPSDGLAVFENVVRARIQGFEFSSLLEIIPGYLNASLGYTYLWARDVDKNKALKYRPRHSLISNLDLTIGKVGFGVYFRYSSKVEEIDEELIDLGIVADGDLRVPIYVTDLRLSYELIDLGIPANIYFNAKNIFNYNYVELIGNLKQIRNYSLGFNLIL